MKKARRGAASFYIVAVSTLILVMLATSFATVIISEVARTSNDDLSQSAYDSAMAGLEDAKVAYSSYRRCVEAGVPASTMKPSGTGAITCGDIRYWLEVENDCYTVGHILGRIPKDEETEVVVGSTQTTGSSTTSTNQAYTCVKIETELDDYRVTLNEENRRQTMRAQVGTGATNTVKKIRVSWTAVKTSASDTLGLNYPNLSGGNLAFAPWNYATMANPPVVELQIVQTAPTFSLSQFDDAVVSGASSQTNRASMFLIPTKTVHSTNTKGIGTWSGSITSGKNVITAAQVAQTNDRTVYHKPFGVFCNPNTSSNFYCSVEVELPSPIGSSGGVRNNGTFMIAVSLPYQQPDTDFAIELICDAGATCGDGIVADSMTGGVRLTNTQILMDSTGRANDLYRRVQARMETSDRAFDASYPIYALEVLGSNPVTKTVDAKYEYNFYF